MELVPNQNSLLGGNIVQRQTPLVVVNDEWDPSDRAGSGWIKVNSSTATMTNKEKDRDLVLEKRPEGGFPVGIIGIAAPLRVRGVEFGKGEGFLVAQFRRDILPEAAGRACRPAVSVALSRRV